MRMKLCTIGILITGLVSCTILQATAQGAPSMNQLPKGYVCHRTTGPIKVDGKLDEPSWLNVPWTDYFHDIEGADKKQDPRFRTRAKMVWDDEYFYIGAYLEEPHVWATLTQRDSVIFNDNDFEIFIDPNSDNHQYYEFEMNALNTVWDLRLVKPYKDGGPALTEWNIEGLKTGVFVDGTINDPSDTDKGWSVEIAFPWKALSEYAAPRVCPPQDGDQWRINFSRVEWQIELVNGKYTKVPNTKEDNWVWSPQGVVDMHRPERWGYVQFSARPYRSRGPDVEFVRDPTEPARDALHQIYYAQRVYAKQNRAFAKSIEDLGITVENHSSFKEGPVLTLTDREFSASIVVQLPDGGTRKVTILQDSLVTEE